MEEIKVSEMLQADSINKDDSVMIIQDGVNKKASGSIETATGTSISVDSVADICKIKSNSKNLFDAPYDNSNARGITGIWNKSTLEIHGTATTSIQSPYDKRLSLGIFEAGTYTISTTLLSGSIPTPVGTAFYLRNETSGENIARISVNNGTPVTYTLSASTLLSIYVYIDSGTAFNRATFGLQIETGSSATTYNPYDTEVLVTAKNVFNQSKIINPPANGTQYPIILTLKPNTQYTMSSNCPDSSGFALIFFVSGTDYSSVTSSNNGIWEGQTKTFTSDSNGNMVVVYRRNTGDTNIDLTDYWYQIEEGSTATAYEPYKGYKVNIVTGETKTAFTNNGVTNIVSDGLIDVTFNKQARVLNNDDTKDIENLTEGHLTNVSTQIDNTYPTNIISSKNLFNLMGTYTNNGVTYTFNGSELTMNGTTTGEGGYAGLNSLPIFATLEAGWYTLSFKLLNGTRTSTCNAIIRDIESASNYLDTPYSETSTYTFLIPKTSRIAFTFYSFSNRVYTNYQVGIQLEKGKTATSYERYVTPSIYANGNLIYQQPTYNDQFKLTTIRSSTGSGTSISFTDDNAGSKAYIVIASKTGTDGTYCDLWFIRLGATAITKIAGTGTGTATVSISGNTITVGGLATYSYVVVYQVMNKTS